MFLIIARDSEKMHKEGQNGDWHAHPSDVWHYKLLHSPFSIHLYLTRDVFEYQVVVLGALCNVNGSICLISEISFWKVHLEFLRDF
ncbi:Polyketide synthase-like protein [Dirofilaria immitis]